MCVTMADPRVCSKKEDHNWAVICIVWLVYVSECTIKALDFIISSYLEHIIIEAGCDSCGVIIFW